MKTEYPYFGYCPDSGFETFKTAEEAKAYANESIDGYRDYAACDGWDESVENACWGLIKQVSTQCDKRDVEPGEGDFSYICDYQLRSIGSDVTRELHAAWSDYTFGDAGALGALRHLSQEALEAAENPSDLSEWADMQMLMWDAVRRAGISDEQLMAAVAVKLDENIKRKWGDVVDGQPCHHVK